MLAVAEITRQAVGHCAIEHKHTHTDTQTHKQTNTDRLSHTHSHTKINTNTFKESLNEPVHIHTYNIHGHINIEDT